MFYLIGIESIDLFHLKQPQNGRVFYDRFKTGRLYSIKLEPEAIKIIEKYPGSNNLINVSERFKQSKSFLHFINNYLHGENYHKIVGITQKTGINKKVTSKWANIPGQQLPEMNAASIKMMLPYALAMKMLITG